MARPTFTSDDDGYRRPATSYPTTDYHAARERVAATDGYDELYEEARRRIAEAQARRRQRTGPDHSAAADLAALERYPI